MLPPTIKMAFRRLTHIKSRNYTLLNIFGLALGLACCLLIGLYVLDERSYDRWIPEHERVYRVAMDITAAQGEHMYFAPASGTLADALLEYGQVTDATRILPIAELNEEQLLMSEDGQRKFYESNLFFADPNVFDLFPYPLLEGDQATALVELRSVVLSRETAEKLFGQQGSYQGQSLRIDGDVYQVKGILAELPTTTSFRPNMLVSMAELEGRQFMDNWHATIFHTFIKLAPGTDPVAFESEVHHIADQYVADQIDDNQQDYRYFLQPLASIHLHSDLRYELSKNNSARYLNIFLLIAGFILFIAAINFVNLATALAGRRAREIGVRKVSGARRGQLAGQFLSEAMLVSVLAGLLATLLVYLALPLFNLVAEKQLSYADLMQPSFIGLGIGMSLLVGILAGAYPAWYLSRFSPASIFQDRLTGSRQSGRWLRNSLVVGQFAISIFIIVATLVVDRQLSFLRQQDLGFDQEQLLVIHAPGGGVLQQEFRVLREAFTAHPAVKGASATNTVPGRGIGNNMVRLKQDHSKATDMQMMMVDDRFLETYGVSLLAGRNLSETIASDTTPGSRSLLINEAALPVFGWETADEAIGQEFDDGWGTVIGVVGDFHYTSLQTDVLPLVLFYRSQNFSYLSLKVQPDQLATTLPELEQIWESQISTHPFGYFFADTEFAQQYQFETRLQRLFSAFAFIAILIACLGLFGLATYAISQRTKEIGIRKVLGATATGVVSLLSRDFLKLVFLALLIATPLAWWAMNNWLTDFAYRIQIPWWLFVLAGGLTLGIAFLTISFQSIKAATANPVHSLRSE